MHVVAQQGPSITGCNRLLQQTQEPLDKILQVRVIFKYRFAFDPSNDNSLQGTEGIYADFTGMADLSRSQNYCKYINRTDVPVLP